MTPSPEPEEETMKTTKTGKPRVTWHPDHINCPACGSYNYVCLSCRHTAHGGHDWRYCYRCGHAEPLPYPPEPP
jgi:transcription elongation factor Elf1